MQCRQADLDEWEGLAGCYTQLPVHNTAPYPSIPHKSSQPWCKQWVGFLRESGKYYSASMSRCHSGEIGVSGQTTQARGGKSWMMLDILQPGKGVAINEICCSFKCAVILEYIISEQERSPYNCKTEVRPEFIFKSLKTSHSWSS